MCHQVTSCRGNSDTVKKIINTTKKLIPSWIAQRNNPIIAAHENQIPISAIIKYTAFLKLYLMPFNAFDPPYRDVDFDKSLYILPLGIWLPNGERLREFTLKTYISRHDLELGRLEDRYRDQPFAIRQIYGQFLPQIIDSVGGYTWEQLGEIFQTSTLRIIEQCYLVDVIVMALTVRYISYGSELGLVGTCPCSEEVKIVGGENTGYHDLGSIVLRELPGHINDLPQFQVEVGDRTFILEPPRFTQIPELANSELPLDIRLTLACSQPRINYEDLTIDEIDRIRAAIRCIYFGPDRGIDQDCPQCGMEWISYLEYGRDYEKFYLSLLRAPRLKDEPGSTEQYLNKIMYFLNTGSDAPKINIYDVTPSSRDFFTEELGEFYKQQEKKMKQSSAKSSSSRSSHKRPRKNT